MKSRKPFFLPPPSLPRSPHTPAGKTTLLPLSKLPRFIPFVYLPMFILRFIFVYMLSFHHLFIYFLHHHSPPSPHPQGGACGASVRIPPQPHPPLGASGTHAASARGYPCKAEGSEGAGAKAIAIRFFFGGGLRSGKSGVGVGCGA